MLQEALEWLARKVTTKPDSETIPYPDGSSAVLHRADFEVLAVDGPQRLRTTFRFADLASFVSWLKGAPPTFDGQVIIALDGGWAVDDPDDPNSDIATVTFAKSSAFQSWVEVLRQGHTSEARALYWHVRRLGDAITNEADRLALLAGLQTMTVTRGENIKVVLDRDGNPAVVASEQTQEISATIPAEFTVRLTPLLDAPEFGYDIQVRAGIVIDDKAPRVRLQAANLDEVLWQIPRDCAAKVSAEVGDGWFVGVGQVTESKPVAIASHAPPEK